MQEFVTLLKYVGDSVQDLVDIFTYKEVGSMPNIQETLVFVYVFEMPEISQETSVT